LSIISFHTKANLWIAKGYVTHNGVVFIYAQRVSNYSKRCSYWNLALLLYWLKV